MTLSGRILVTGGAGYLARGLYRRAQRERWDAEFTALSRDDSKHAALQARFPFVDTVLADVGLTPVEELAWLMRGYDVVIHAAASKYVDRAEGQAFDTVRTNVEGSVRVARAAIAARVPEIIGISTDKAVQPVNVYGATKMLMERVFQEAQSLSPASRFKVVRYGNVVGSTGSVITIFERALREERPLRVTDPLMTRFWMGVDEALDAILWARHYGDGGTVIVPRLRAMSMRDLVRCMLGFDESGPLPDSVEIIGVRPGEKRHEAIMHSAESVRSRAAGNYFQIEPATTPLRVVDPGERLVDVTSADPPGGWLGPADMRVLIEDARELA